MPVHRIAGQRLKIHRDDSKGKNEPKIVEKEKVVAEKLNGRFAMLGFVALVGAYLTTGQIIPGFI